MATVTKSRARSHVGVGTPSVAYANYNIPGLETKQHIQVVVGDMILRFTFREWQNMNAMAQGYIKEHAPKDPSSTV